MTGRPPERAYLLDVSRLIWRLWTKRLPTGIDRVCLEYLDRFADRSLAVVQRRGSFFVLSPPDSDRLFQLLRNPASFSRGAFVALATRALPRARRAPPRPGMVYLNVGHTGLDEPNLPDWVRATGIRAIHLVHDLIPLTHPETCRPGEVERHERRIANLLTSATGVIGNSQATLDNLASFAARRGLDMPEAVAAWIGGHRPDPGIRPRSLEHPHFVILGTIEGRKNHLLLLRIWRRLVAKLGERAPILVIIGQRGWQAREAIAILDDLGELAGHVRELGRCSDQQLTGWLRGARALLMPSIAEGFGLPVVEALQLGTPVIASDLPVYREIAGNIPCYLDPLDATAWEAAIEEYTVDSPRRDEQRQRLDGYRAPDWPAHFAIVERWLDTL